MRNFLIFFCILISAVAVNADVEFDYQTVTPVIVGPMNSLITSDHFTISNMGAAQDITFDIRYTSDNINDYIGICDNIGCLTPPVAVSFGADEEIEYHFSIYVEEAKSIDFELVLTAANIQGEMTRKFTYITDNVELLVVNDDPVNDYTSYYVNGLDNSGMTYGIWNTHMSPIDNNTPAFSNILWATGDETDPISTDEISYLSTHLMNGSNLIMTGQNLCSGLSNGNTDQQNFLQTYLYVSFDGDNSGVTSIEGVSSDGVSDGWSFAISGGDGADNQTSPDEISATTDAIEFLMYPASRGAAGVKLRSTLSNSYIATLGFGIEGIDSEANRSMVIGGLIDYIQGETANGDTEVKSFDNISLSNYPNPFNPETTIKYNVKELRSNASLTIYNVKGQAVKHFTYSDLNNDSGSVIWKGMSDNSEKAASGVYFYKLINGSENVMRKMVLIK